MQSHSCILCLTSPLVWSCIQSVIKLKSQSCELSHSAHNFYAVITSCTVPAYSSKHHRSQVLHDATLTLSPVEANCPTRTSDCNWWEIWWKSVWGSHVPKPHPKENQPLVQQKVACLEDSSNQHWHTKGEYLGCCLFYSQQRYIHLTDVKNVMFACLLFHALGIIKQNYICEDTNLVWDNHVSNHVNKADTCYFVSFTASSCLSSLSKTDYTYDNFSVLWSMFCSFLSYFLFYIFIIDSFE